MTIRDFKAYRASRGGSVSGSFDASCETAALDILNAGLTGANGYTVDHLQVVSNGGWVWVR